MQYCAVFNSDAFGQCSRCLCLAQSCRIELLCGRHDSRSAHIVAAILV